MPHKLSFWRSSLNRLNHPLLKTSHNEYIKYTRNTNLLLRSERHRSVPVFDLKRYHMYPCHQHRYQTLNAMIQGKWSIKLKTQQCKIKKTTWSRKFSFKLGRTSLSNRYKILCREKILEELSLQKKVDFDKTGSLLVRILILARKVGYLFCVSMKFVKSR